MSKLTRIADGFRPKEKPVYEAEPVNLPPPHDDPFQFRLDRAEPRSIVDKYQYEAAKERKRIRNNRYRRSTHR